MLNASSKDVLRSWCVVVITIICALFPLARTPALLAQTASPRLLRFAGTMLPLLTQNTINLAAGDLNGDGRIDLVTYTAAGKFVVYLRQEDGLFQEAGNYTVSGLTAYLGVLQIVDVNGDRKADVIYADYSNARAGYFLGLGDGGLAPAQNLPTTDRVNKIDVGNLNGDAWPDLALFSTRRIRTFYGNSSGGFTIDQAYDVAGNTGAIQDVNGDGLGDLVIAGGNSGLTILLSVPGGGFRSPRTIIPDGTYTASMGLAAADVNGDGVMDVVTTVYAMPGPIPEIHVYLGSAGGLSTQPVRTALALSTPAQDQIVVDVNNDGVPDVITRSEGAFAVHYGAGDGSFKDTQLYPYAIRDFALLDVTFDGIPDIVSPGTFSSPGTLTVFAGLGDGRFQSAVKTDMPCVPINTADFNGDGSPDLFCATEGAPYTLTFTTLLNDGHGNFTPAPPVPKGFVSAWLLADVNNDHVPDLITVPGTPEGYALPYLEISLGDGQGGFRPPQRLDFPGAVFGMDVADVDGDKNMDLVVILAGNQMVTCFGDGTGSYRITPPLKTANPPAGGMIDLNGDGKADVVGVFAYELGNGDGTYQDAVRYAGISKPLVSGDFNGDGVPDLLLADTASPALFILAGQTLLYTGDLPFRQFGTPKPNVAYDVDGNGASDLLFGEIGGATVIAYMKDFAVRETLFFKGLGGRMLLADFNGDGKPDILFVDNGGGQMLIQE